MEFLAPYIHNGTLSFAGAAICLLLAIPTYRWGNKFGSGLQVGLGFMNIAVGLMNIVTH